MFSRLVGAAPRVAGRRPYSFFSSKPPGGMVNKQQQQQQQSQSQQTNNVVKRIAAPSTPTPTPAASKSTATATTTTTATTQVAPAPAAEPKIAPVPAPPAPPPIPTLHPSPVLATMHLHSFFALDRPMLLLSQPTSRLFDTGLPLTRAQPDVDTAGMESDADADAARALSHALVMSRVKGAVDWKAALQRLGVDASSAADVKEEARVGGDLAVLLDSVKRKRRKKITKHKYKKRRKLQRSERRRLGK